MAPRSFWKGYLKLSLVTCPVTMMPATSESGKVRFHTLNRKTGNRVVSRYVDSVTRTLVDEADEVRGYQRDEDDYVLLEDEDIEDVALESTRTIDIEMFVPADEIGWIWYDKPHYLVPDDKIGEEAFAVIREAMSASKVAGISRLVMYRRERAVLLEPRDGGIVLWTLRYGDEVRNADDYFAGLDNGAPEAGQLSLMNKYIKAHTRKWDSSLAEDPVQERLLEIIESRKKKQKGRPAKPKAEPPGNVINIMDALKESLARTRKK
ncbi:Ku protein [Rhizobium sp. KVB221]|uniref:Non-homologous end joining protein Ku n=1 Tax=Rhizobium setariae TaxID=2801340 RepID=A0A936YV29_9HYPH|nr:Ku protein [Rhizobium setariae]MBL0375424.1 Ku protein [Rhizobium setariae]